MDYYNNIFYPDYLMHYGVKGMKWGHRKRYYDASGNLNARGIKKYAQKGYAQDSYNSNKTRAGKVYDKVTNAHNYGGKMMYNMSSNKANKARAEKYVADQQAKKEAANSPEAKAARKEKAKKAAKVGAAVAGTALAAYGAYKVHNMVREKNRQIRVGQELLEANRMIEMNRSNFNTKGMTNQQRATVNKHFNTYAKNVLDSAKGSGNYNASKDSFGTAVRNVYDEYRRSRR